MTTRSYEGLGRGPILHVVNSLRRGGAERTVVDLVVGQARNGLDSRVLCLFEEGPFAHEVQAAGVPVHALGLAVGEWRKALALLTRSLGRSMALVLHTHLQEACWLGLTAGAATRIPVRVSHLQNCHVRWSRSVRRLDRATARFAHCSIACSDAVRRFYVDQVRYSTEKIVTIPNAVELSRFRSSGSKEDARRSLGLPTGDVTITCVASLTPQKGHLDLLRAVADLKRRGLRPSVLLVGDGPERTAIAASIGHLGIAHQVRLFGGRDDVPLIMAASDVAVLTSRWEGLGLVLAEAAAAGVATVGYAVGGIPEVVDDGITGLLVPPGDIPALAEALARLLHDPALRQRLGDSGRLRAEQHFSADKLVARVSSLYVSLLRSAA